MYVVTTDNDDGGATMLSAKILLILGGGAVLPYAAEALWSWAKERKAHRNGALKQDMYS